MVEGGDVNDLEQAFSASKREVIDLTADLERLKAQLQTKPPMQQMLEAQASAESLKLRVRWFLVVLILTLSMSSPLPSPFLLISNKQLDNMEKQLQAADKAKKDMAQSYESQIAQLQRRLAQLELDASSKNDSEQTSSLQAQLRAAKGVADEVGHEQRLVPGSVFNW